MNRRTQSGIVVIIGVITVTATLNGLFLNFVKPSLKIPLVAAGVLLVVLGAYGMFAPEPVQGSPTDEDTEEAAHHEAATAHGHDHERGPRIGWLLVVPFLTLSMVVPPPLGAFSAKQDSGRIRASAQSTEGLPAIPMSEGGTQMSLSEYSARALFDEGRSLEGQQVRLVGFVSSVEGGAGWALSRMALSCCAADGYAIKVDVVGGERLPDDTWIEVVGRWRPTPADVDPDKALAIIEIASMRQTAKPANPYE